MTRLRPLLVFTALWRCQAFTRPRLRAAPVIPTTRLCYAGSSSSNNKRQTPNSSKRYTVKSTSASPRRTLNKPAEHVEEELQLALDALKAAVLLQNSANKSVVGATNVLLFPTTRECNGALAALGDSRDFLRALRLFGKMKKAARLRLSLNMPVPAPTLVTYSTLMSRLIKANKPAIALRLWNLRPMSASERIDVRAANILMNAYAKLADVESAAKLLSDCKDVTNPHMPAPNLITYNTFLAACQRAGDLDAAVAAVSDMRNNTSLHPDTRTYTSLIATVARRPTKLAGKNDPTPAFEFLREMQAANVVPNGMTYSALIDACGRCGRSDLALQGLRIMLRQKSETEQDSLANEVGAWTAAINACGKAGRLETAVKLFYTMPNFSVQPNTVTCGCLTDCLLRAGSTADTLDVLRYMKLHGIAPSEVMYTSLMSRAETLVKMERQKQPYQRRDRHVSVNSSSSSRKESTTGDELSEDTTKAIEIYTELIESLIDTGATCTTAMSSRSKGNRLVIRSARQQQGKSLPLLRAFLVFQEMKSAGVKVDLPCYNTLLRACAQAGDVDRSRDVLRKIEADGLDPNDTSWRLALRSASTTAPNGNLRNRKDTVQLTEAIWQQGLSYRKRKRRIDERVQRKQWRPSVDSFLALAAVYMREAKAIAPADPTYYYRRVVQLYEDSLMGNYDMGMDRIDINSLLDSKRAMLVILQAMVMLDALLVDDDERSNVRSMATAILELECFREGTGPAGHSARRALKTVRSWAHQDDYTTARR